MLGDPILIHEVTCEALRIAVTEKLGGFQHVTITRPPVHNTDAPAKATFDFTELSLCIRRLVRAYDDLSTRLEDVQRPLLVLEKERDSMISPEAKNAVTDLRQILETAVALQKQHEDEAIAAVPNIVAKPKGGEEVEGGTDDES